MTNGVFKAIVRKRSAIALHTAAKGSAGSATTATVAACTAAPVPSGYVAVSFTEKAKTVVGEVRRSSVYHPSLIDARSLFLSCFLRMYT